MEPRSKQRRTAGEQSATVVFNVSGRHFEVLRQTIQAHPDTLLASLSEDIGTDSSQPIFVDANPDRFGYILDWYRFGEMHLPENCPIAGVLRDARFFLLPDFVRINGTSQHLCPQPANDASDAGVDRVVDHWPGFAEYVSGIIAELRNDIDAAGKEATQVQDDVLSCSSIPTLVEDTGLPRKRIVLTRWCERSKRHIWADQDNVCNRLRLVILLSELAKRGFHCDMQAPSQACSRCAQTWARCCCNGYNLLVRKQVPNTEMELLVGQKCA